MSPKPQLILDIECYKNYFLIMLMSVKTGKTAAFEMYEGKVLAAETIKALLARSELITFNGIGYDMPLLSAAFTGANCSELRTLSDQIIINDVTPYQFYKNNCISQYHADHVDLINVAPGIASLKIYGGRLHANKLQDLPIDPNSLITPEQRAELKTYCKNDLETTLLLYKKLEQQINLRRSMSSMYGADLRSKSDAQIAETVIVSEVAKRIGCKPPRAKIIQGQFRYTAPAFVSFDTEQLQDALRVATEEPFTIQKNGKIDMPKALKTLKIKLGTSVYQMGMGGLHSTEKCVTHDAKDGNLLFDWDVTSYYPSIILNCGLYPIQMGQPFLNVYREIVTERLTAKANGDKVKADSLKITINGSFGKLGSPYSALYAPELMVQTTVTGQLALLMLIEKLEYYNVPVVSGNTDGIVIKCPISREKYMKLIIEWWEKQTGFNMECSEYQSLHSKDVNNYIAVKTNGEVKTKGCFASDGLQKNPTNSVCVKALIAHLTSAANVEAEIRGCKDVRQFLTIRTVKGGAVDSEGQYIGKAVRWYYAKDQAGCISYSTNGNKVARSDGAKPMMNLGDFPEDIDFEWYITEANKMVGEVVL